MKRILVVEDNEVNRRMLGQWLTRKGYVYGTVENGQLAVDCAHQHQPDLILMDMSLPVKDGWTATREIRDHENTAPIPIIALTAHAMPADRERAKACGCDRFVAKPIDFRQLKQAIDGLLDLSGSAA